MNLKNDENSTWRRSRVQRISIWIVNHFSIYDSINSEQFTATSVESLFSSHLGRDIAIFLPTSASCFSLDSIKKLLQIKRFNGNFPIFNSNKLQPTDFSTFFHYRKIICKTTWSSSRFFYVSINFCFYEDARKILIYHIFFLAFFLDLFSKPCVWIISWLFA